MAIDPRPFALWQLLKMATANATSEWNHTSLLAALVHNSGCNRKSDLKSVADFHPIKDSKPTKRLSNEGSANSLHEMFGVKVRGT